MWSLYLKCRPLVENAAIPRLENHIYIFIKVSSRELVLFLPPIFRLHSNICGVNTKVICFSYVEKLSMFSLSAGKPRPPRPPRPPKPVGKCGWLTRPVPYDFKFRVIKRVLIECRKTQTKLWSKANREKGKYQKEPMRPRTKNKHF